MCAIERSYPKVGVGQILKWYLEYFSRYIHFSEKGKRKVQGVPQSKQHLNLGVNDKE